MTIEDTANAVNLNTATPPLLRAMLRAVGAGEARAGELAAAIVDWREKGDGPAAIRKRQQYLAARLAYAPPEAPFRSVDELGLVVGMSAELLATLKPHLTVWSSYGPARTSADPVIRTAMQRVRQEGGDLPDDEDDDGPRVLAITARLASEGAGIARYAVLRLDPTDKDRPCAILAWESRATARESGSPPD
jgi:general secretion pathway protein K